MAYGAKTYTLREESTESGKSFYQLLGRAGGTPRTGSVRNSYSLNLGRWKGRTETFSNGISGTGSLMRYGTKRFTDVR